jgi:hypothetical protein
MITLFSRKLVRLVMIAGLVATPILAQPASAEIGIPNGTVGSRTFGQIAAGCGASGGSFEVSTDGGYGCRSKDGKSYTTCGPNGVCTCDGPCTDLKKKGGANGTLRPPSSAGTASSTASTPTKRRFPVNAVSRVNMSGGATAGGTHPVLLQRSGGHSGGHR